MRPPRAGFDFVVLLLAALTLVAGGGVNAQDKITGMEYWVPSVSAADRLSCPAKTGRSILSRYFSGSAAPPGA